MAQLAIRLPDVTLARLDVVCAERGLTRSRFVRQLITAALDGAPVEPVDAPTEEELLELLAERARAGNVAAIRSLLLREEERVDPRQRALEALQVLASESRD